MTFKLFIRTFSYANHFNFSALLVYELYFSCNLKFNTWCWYVDTGFTQIGTMFCVSQMKLVAISFMVNVGLNIGYLRSLYIYLMLFVCLFSSLTQTWIYTLNQMSCPMIFSHTPNYPWGTITTDLHSPQSLYIPVTDTTTICNVHLYLDVDRCYVKGNNNCHTK